jgi:fructose-specific phosphotransferase system IIA component
MKVFELLEESFILTDFKSDDKKDIINELIDLHKEDKNVNDLEKVRTAIHEREKEMSTGIGNGFAIPHGKTNAVKDVIVSFGKTTRDIDYNALDGNPVHLVFLLVGKVDLVSKYIKLLSRISRVMNKDDFREKILNAKTKDEIINIFKEEEKHYIDV